MRPIRVRSAVKMTTPLADPVTTVVPQKPRFFVSGFQKIASNLENVYQQTKGIVVSAFNGACLRLGFSSQGGVVNAHVLLLQNANIGRNLTHKVERKRHPMRNLVSSNELDDIADHQLWRPQYSMTKSSRRDGTGRISLLLLAVADDHGERRQQLAETSLNWQRVKTWRCA